MREIFFKFFSFFISLFTKIRCFGKIHLEIKGLLKKCSFKNKGEGNVLNVGYRSKLMNVEFDLICSGSRIFIGSRSRLSRVKFHLVGSNHTVRIGDDVIMNGGCIWIEDDRSAFILGDRTYIEQANFSITGKDKEILIGKECLFSDGISFRTGDSHAIIDCETNKKINEEQNIKIGNRVWIGNGVAVLKGVEVGCDTVIGTKSLLTKSVPSNCVVGGVPAKVLKTGVKWSADRYI